MNGAALLMLVLVGALLWRLSATERRRDDTAAPDMAARKRAYRRRERGARDPNRAAYLARVERGLAIKAALAGRERGGARA